MLQDKLRPWTKQTLSMGSLGHPGAAPGVGKHQSWRSSLADAANRAVIQSTSASLSYKLQIAVGKPGLLQVCTYVLTN